MLFLVVIMFSIVEVSQVIVCEGWEDRLWNDTWSVEQTLNSTQINSTQLSVVTICG